MCSCRSCSVSTRCLPVVQGQQYNVFILGLTDDDLLRDGSTDDVLAGSDLTFDWLTSDELIVDELTADDGSSMNAFIRLLINLPEDGLDGEDFSLPHLFFFPSGA